MVQPVARRSSRTLLCLALLTSMLSWRGALKQATIDILDIHNLDSALLNFHPSDENRAQSKTLLGQGTQTQLLSDTFPPIKRESVCVPWSVNSDEWWTHNPDWFISLENSSHYCFSPMPESSPKALLFRRLYNNQFQNDCRNVMTINMWNSGWGADITNIIQSLQLTLETKRPLQTLAKRGSWHYAALKNGSRPACPLKNQYCYFLNMTNCDPTPENIEAPITEPTTFRNQTHMWLAEFATRPQTWLRKQVYDYTQAAFRLQTPCSVVHVRRADVVLHGKSSRRYHPMEEYMQDSYALDPNVLLLTDDQNAIPEAEFKFPDYNWMYEHRPRHRGTEGGWENHFPSGDPKQEMVIILSTFQAIKKCHKLVRSYSNIGIYFEGIMKEARGDDFTLYNIDENQRTANISFSRTKHLSKPNWSRK
jgi:hypothetical protein